MSEEYALQFLQANMHLSAPELEDGRLDLNNAGQFDAVLHSLCDLRAARGVLTCEFTVPASLCNRRGTLHGGAIGTIVDILSTGALATQSERLGVSLNINTDYLIAIPQGEQCKVVCKVVKLGRTIATLNVELWRQKTGQLAAQGRHVKFLDTAEKRLEAWCVVLGAVPAAY
ncbi:hypothetical protein WJX73_006267 [Symbiochloris irregularis]|uniref:Thioesterase domain-containing protein n=1 Tax=Symbiochloris irregularis TaxID=706552 RepID=A0AAW1NY55_9CHLO